jgi:hypothetical protein
MDSDTEVSGEDLEIMTKAIDETIVVLDREIPEWRKSITLDSFVFVSYGYCVAGQLDLFTRERDFGPRKLDERFADCEGFDVPARIAVRYRDDGCMIPNCFWNTMEEIWKNRLDTTLAV